MNSFVNTTMLFVTKLSALSVFQTVCNHYFFWYSKMILDESRVSRLLSNDEVKMEKDMDYRSHNVNVLPAMGRSGYHDNDNDNGFGGNGFLQALLFLGLIDRQGNRTGQNATQEQVQHLATTTGLNDVAIKSKLDAMQISICEQTSTLKDSIHSSSTANAMGQNALGEKITNVGFRVESNAKDIEKTVLIDGSLSRKNDDDNSGKNLTAQTIGFHNVEKSLCDLDSKLSGEICDIKGLIKDVKYDVTQKVEEKGNAIIVQATHNYNETIRQITEARNEAVITNKNDQIRLQEMEVARLKDTASIARDLALQKELEEMKCERKRASENEVLSHNINIGNKTAIGDNNFNNRFSAMERSISDMTIIVNSLLSNNRFVGNSLSIGGRNNDTGIGN